MVINDNEIVTERRLRNRFTLVRNRIIRRMAYLNNNPHLDPRKQQRFMAKVKFDQKELELLNKWITLAQKRGGSFIWKNKRNLT